MHDFTILVVPGAHASSVALSLDILTAAATMAPRVGTATPTWQVRSPQPGPVHLSNGMIIDTKPLPKRVKPDRSIWVLPGLATKSVAEIRERLIKPDAIRVAHALRVQANAGGTLAASCSAVFLLQIAGLLVNRKVTTTWWLAGYLQQLESRCVVDANRMVIMDGSIWTAGAALAHTDLMLQLIRNRYGATLAEATSRVLLIDAREAQSKFIAPAMLANGNDFIAQLSQQIEAALPRNIGIPKLAAKLCVSERTLARRVQTVTGRNTSALVQLVRLKRARLLLETSRMSVAQVAEQVGYRDTTALRRLMRKVLGITPRQLR